MQKIKSKKQLVPVPPSLEVPLVTPTRVRRFSWKWVIIGLIFVFFVLLAANRGWVIVALVDGKPIYSWSLNTLLRSRYGQQTLEGMIGETLIEKEAKKSDVVITDKDLQDKQNEILSSLGESVNLSDFLKFQGISESEFNQQLRVQLVVERLLTKDLVIAEQDIDRYIATNRALLVSTDAAKLRDEARRAIISSTVSEKIQEWFVGLRSKANVIKFL